MLEKVFRLTDGTKKGGIETAFKIYSTIGAEGSMSGKPARIKPVIEAFLPLVECFGTVSQEPGRFAALN